MVTHPPMDGRVAGSLIGWREEKSTAQQKATDIRAEDYHTEQLAARRTHTNTQTHRCVKFDTSRSERQVELGS